MTWSYSGNPANSPLDLYRFKISDTDPLDPILQDEEIDYVLSQYTDENHILYALFKQAALTFSREYKRSLGPQSEDPSSRLKFYTDKAAEYKLKILTGGFNTKCSKPIFKIGMHDNV